jgi:hypothetical protein
MSGPCRTMAEVEAAMRLRCPHMWRHSPAAPAPATQPDPARRGSPLQRKRTARQMEQAAAYERAMVEQRRK